MPMGQISFATSDSLPLVALLCFASVIFLAVCVRNYFASRVEEAPAADSVPIPHRIELQRAADARQLDDAVEASITRVVQTWSAPPLAPGQKTYLGSDEDQRQTQRRRATAQPGL